GVAFGTATVYFIYRSYRLIFEHKASAYFAAAAYAFSLVPVAMSHWGKAHNAMVLFLVLSLYFVLCFEKEKRLKHYYFSLAAAALSLSAHYIGVSAFIFPFCGLIFNFKLFNRRVLLNSVVISFLTVLIFYLVPFKGIWSMITNVTENYYANTGFTGLYPVGAIERFYYVFLDSFFVEPVFMALFGAVLLIFFRKIAAGSFTRYILWGLAFNYFLMITIIVGPELTRWLLVFMVLALPLGAATLAEWLARRQVRAAWLALIFCLLSAFPAYISVNWLMLLKHNTWAEAASWLAENLNGEEAAYSFTQELVAPLSYQAALYHRDVNGVTSSDKINYILEKKSDCSVSGVNLYYDVGKNRFSDLGGPETKYVVFDYWTNGNDGQREYLSTKASVDKELAEIEKFHKLSLAYRISPLKPGESSLDGMSDYINNPLRWWVLKRLEKSGPIVEIYSVD
ncbi:MAG: glycosyltransferase family 39 protein, partial [Planctomycetes bacterium]|nr:glycosyltransferase family 39 protein [Planctomycetota bacterium]